MILCRILWCQQKITGCLTFYLTSCFAGGIFAKEKAPSQLYVRAGLKVTPAMEAGLTDHIWEINELLVH